MIEAITLTLNIMFFGTALGVGFMVGIYWFCKLTDWSPTKLVVINKFNCDEGITVKRVGNE